MALRQLLGATCLALYILISSVGGYGVLDQSRGFYGKSQEPHSNSTGYRGSGLNTAEKSSKLDRPTSEGNLVPQTTTLSEQSHGNAGSVSWDRPGLLQTIVSGDNATVATKTFFSSSKPTIISGSRSSTDNLDQVRGSSRGNSITSRNRPTYSSAHSDILGAVRVSNARLRLNGSSASTWSPATSIASLASPNYTTGTTISGSVLNHSTNASASLSPMAAASDIGDNRRLGVYLDSVENRTENHTRISLWLGRRPPYYRPAGSRFPWIGSDTIPGPLDSKPDLLMATGSGGVSSTLFKIAPSGGGSSSASRYSLPSSNKNKTKGGTEGVKPLSSSVGPSLAGLNTGIFNQTGHHLGVSFGDRYATNCSGLVTSTAHVVYELVTSTLLVNETITLGQNATTPLPVLITPPPACQTITVPCEGQYCPTTSPRLPVQGPHPKKPMPKLTPSTSTSTLLVTKKSAAVVQQLSAVGNLFGPAPPIVTTQPNSGDQQTAGQHSGSSHPEMSTQSDDSSSSEPGGDGQPPQNPNPPQNPTNGNSQSTPSSNQDSDSQKPAAGPSGSQSTGNNDQTPSNAHGPDGAASNNAATSGHGDAISSGDAPGNGAMSSNGGTSNSGYANSGGVASSHEMFLNNGDASNDEGVSSSGDLSTSEGGISINGEDSSNREGPEPKGGSSVDSPDTQYVSSLITAGNLPISIISNAVLVGPHTVKAGSPPTTVLAKGQRILIEPSQIVAEGRTYPIKAAMTPPPAVSATIGNLPVVLQPQNLAIGSKTFEHGSSPTSVVYQGQTYSWDASHLVGAGTTVAFPSVDSAPRVTAGGQVFSVFPSQLQAPGRNIPIPNIATTSPFVYKGQTFSINPSQIIASDTSITLPTARRVTPFVYIDHTVSVDASQFMARSTTIPLIAGSGIVTYNGQVLTIKPSKVIGPSTTVALTAQDDSAASPTAITTGGLTFSIGPSAAVVGSSTYSFIPGKAPSTIETHGEVVLVGSNGVQFKNVHIPIPTTTPIYSVITHGDLSFSIAPSKVVVGDHTDIIHSDMTPITTVVHGHTISIGPKGVGLAGITIPLPAPKPTFSMATRGEITFSVAPSEVVVKDKTYSVASNKAPVTTTIDGQRLTIGPKGIRIEGTTVNFPAIRTQMRVTAAGVALSVGATDVVISGTTYAIGSGAPSQTVVLGSQTVRIGSAGVELPSTTIAPEQTPMAVTAGGLTFSIESTEAVVNGTTYAIGSGAAAKTIVKGSTTIRLGTAGVEFPSTTIRPWLNATHIGSSAFLAASDTFSVSTAIRGLTPIATGREGGENHGAGSSTRGFHSSTFMGILLGIVLLGMMLI